jgi:hypothetical protein
MNFVAHYYIDSHLDNGLFVTGVSSPDLIPVFDRKKRVRDRWVRKVLDRESEPAFREFAKGALRHFEADDYFHSADFFQAETQLITQLLRERFEKDVVQRDFFVAHILFELVLDRILVQENPEGLDKYYDHWRNTDTQQLRLFSEKLCNDSLEGYELFIKRFIKRRYLYGFVEWKNLIYILKRIMDRVGILDTDYFYTAAFFDLLEVYENHLRPMAPQYIDEIRLKLDANPLD